MLMGKDLPEERRRPNDLLALFSRPGGHLGGGTLSGHKYLELGMIFAFDWRLCLLSMNGVGLEG